MAYKDFVNDLRKGITPPVMFFYGAEEYLMSWAEDQIISRYVEPEFRNLDLRILEGDRTSAYEIMGESRAYSMFSERRVVVVRDYLPLYRKTSDAGGDELLDFARKDPGSSIVIFTLGRKHSQDLNAYGKKLAKACGYDFATLERVDLKAFINKRIHGAGKMIARRELEYLIDLTGYYNKVTDYDLTRLDADLDKITRACEGDEISGSLIEELLIGDDDRYVFNLVDAAVSGARGRALDIAESIIREEDGAMQVTALLVKQFEIMYDALELSSLGLSISEMAKMTGVNEFRFKKAYQAARGYSMKRLRELLIQIYNIDRDIKRGDIDKDVALELFILAASAR